jgi:hypothetical protein
MRAAGMLPTHTVGAMTAETAHDGCTDLLASNGAWTSLCSLRLSPIQYDRNNLPVSGGTAYNTSELPRYDKPHTVQ